MDEGCGVGDLCELPPVIQDPEDDGDGGNKDAGLAVPDWAADLIGQAAIKYYMTAWWIDAWLYQNIPTAFGLIIVDGSASYLAGGEGQLVYLFNWRSFELDKYVVVEEEHILESHLVFRVQSTLVG